MAESITCEDAALVLQKRCPRCKTVLAAGAFDRCTRNRDGLQTQCRACRRLTRREYEERNADILAQREAERRDRLPELAGTKRCCRCHEIRPRLAFYAHRSTQDGRASLCIDCDKAATRAWKEANAHQVRTQYANRSRATARRTQRRWWLRLYNLTEQQYDDMLAEQGHRCAICRKQETAVDARSGQPRRLAVDHDHDTGTVRGLLCMVCNRMLGMAKDDPALLADAIKYLTRGGSCG